MLCNYENRLRKLEKQSRKHYNPVLIVDLAEDGTYCHSNGKPVTQEERERTEVLIVNDIPQLEGAPSK